MAGKFGLFILLALFATGSFAQSLLTVLREEGFTEFATLLEGSAGANVLSFNEPLIVYAPTNAALIRRRLHGVFPRDIGLNDLKPEYQCTPKPFHGDKRRRDAVCSDVPGPGAEDLMTLLDDPEFVNLPVGHNASIVQKNMPNGALPVVHTGLGDVVQVAGLDIPYDNGIIRPVSGAFTLPQILSVTLPFLGADKTLGVLQRTGFIKDLDTRTGITFLVPDNRAIPSNLPDDVFAEILRRHVILGTPIFTSDLKHGDSFKTLAGTTVTVTVQCGDVFIGGARILTGDAIIKNGVAHTVDKVFMLASTLLCLV
ncbi:FAS1 domain-containing protein [Apodospora peruviana]|uniref:FAS1 domain-containing protein n=1 Tax=Apodospora peruviana TaxID=516989 RepID=A0AAE0IU85_9PEZI|nr:FAS1 domain-containing protein [Apodospora peruviana]